MVVMKKISWMVVMAGILLGCGTRYDAKESLTSDQYDAMLIKLAPYVIKKPDELTYENRFAKSSIPYYKHILEHTEGEVRYFVHSDSANFFFFLSRDRSSLYEHYRGLGGYYKMNGDSV